MREILFRGKRVDNGEWVEGLLTIMWGQYHIINPSDENTAYPVIPETIGEYTGQTDKNGKKIFEGDIVAMSFVDGYGKRVTCIGVAKYYVDDCCSGFAIFEDGHRALYFEKRNREVIGNIYDNPELLEVNE